MKKALLFTITALLSTNAYAGSFDGPYMGIQGGYDSYHVNGTATLTGFTGSADLGASGGDVGLFAGYGKTFNQLYLGAELEASLNSDKMSLTDSAGDNVGIESKNTYGADVRAGFLPSDSTLLYGSIGAVSTEYDGTGQLVGNTSLTGARFGLGAETVIAPHTTVRLAWSYTAYDSYTYSGGGLTANLSPTENLFRVGIAYNF